MPARRTKAGRSTFRVFQVLVGTNAGTAESWSYAVHWPLELLALVLAGSVRLDQIVGSSPKMKSWVMTNDESVAER